MSAERRRGFTLLEVMAAVSILSLLATLAQNEFRGAVMRARRAEAWEGLQALRQAQAAYYLEHHQYASSFNVLDFRVPGGDLLSGTLYRGGRYTYELSQPFGSATFYATATASLDVDTWPDVLEVWDAGPRIVYDDVSNTADPKPLEVAMVVPEDEEEQLASAPGPAPSASPSSSPSGAPSAGADEGGGSASSGSASSGSASSGSGAGEAAGSPAGSGAVASAGASGSEAPPASSSPAGSVGGPVTGGAGDEGAALAAASAAADQEKKEKEAKSNGNGASGSAGSNGAAQGNNGVSSNAGGSKK